MPAAEPFWHSKANRVQASDQAVNRTDRAVQKPDRLEALGWKPLFSFEEGIEHTFRIIEEA